MDWNRQVWQPSAICCVVSPPPKAHQSPKSLRTRATTRVDGLIRVRYGNAAHVLAIEVKANGAPRFARAAVYQLESYVAHMPRGVVHRAGQVVPMLVSPYLSPESRAICRDHGIAYLDLEGNALLVFDGVYIERSVPSKPKPETRALRSIFTPKAAATLRALLREPGRPWLVTDLAASANASLGHVSNVCKSLLEREWADRRRKTASYSRSPMTCCGPGARTTAGRGATGSTDTPISTAQSLKTWPARC